MNDVTVPPLRPGIQVRQATLRGQEVPVLEDTALGQQVRLNDEAARVAAALDAPQTLTDLATRLDGDAGQVEAAVAWFRGLQLLDTDEARAFVSHARATEEVATADPDTVPLLIRDDARFSCTMCGGCCGGHNIGPVAAEIVDGLRPHAEMLQERTGSAKGLFFALPSAPDAEERIVCHQSGGSCVFLTGEQRCLIHQELGADKKPEVCRLFPYRFVATPDGISVSLQMECRGFVEAREGKPLAEQEEGLRRLLRLSPARTMRPMIAAEPGRALSWPDYRHLEESLHAAVQSAPDEIGALVAMRGELREAAGRADGAPPDRIGAAELTEDLEALLGEIGQSMAALFSLFHQADATHVVSTDALDQMGSALDRLRADLPRAIRPTGHRALFDEMVHHHLAGKELTTASNLSLGLARLTFGWVAARTLMIVRARQVKRVHLVGQDVLDAIVLTRFLLRNVDFLRVFQRHDTAIRSLFYERLPWLVDHATAIAGPDRRLELVKF